LKPAPVLVLDQLAKSFSRTVAVDGISMSIAPGEVFGFLGANGAGKTTTMRMLCGLTKPSSGSGTVAGDDVWKDRYRIRPQFGYVAQKFSLYTDLTVVENLRFFGEAYRVTGKRLNERVETLLQQLDLADKRAVLAGRLSGGMRQLLAVACALVHEPALLFLDEPTSGLDPVHRQQIWDLLYELSHRGMTIFVTTHYMDEAERCTEVGFLHRGRLLAKESPLKLKSHFKGKLLELQVEPAMEALARFRGVKGILGIALRSGRVRIYSAQAEQLLAEWERHWPFPELTFQGYAWMAPDMEDVFKAYSQGYTEILEQPPLPE
jgi:ABC-2 type transport system ATP-binding protein